MEFKNKGNEIELLFDGIVGEDITVKDVNGITPMFQSAESIKVLINSPGGYITDGWAIFNTMINYKNKIDVEIIGLAASMGSVIALCGRSLKMRKGAQFMIHNPWTVAIGDSEQLRSDANLLDKMKEDIVNLYLSKTALNREEIIDLMDKETWFNAEEALDYGFADSIDENVLPAVACIGKMQFKNLPEQYKEKEVVTAFSNENNIIEKFEEKIKQKEENIKMDFNKDELKKEIMDEVLAKIPAGRELEDEKASAKNEGKWFYDYLINGTIPPKNATTKTSDGYGVPTLIEAEVLKKRDSASIMRKPFEGVEDARKRVYSADTKMTFKSSAEAEFIAEGADYPNNTDKGSAVAFDSFKYGSIYSVTEELAEDTIHNVVADFNDDAGRAAAKKENIAFFVGDGTDEPEGMISGSTAAVTTASATAITYDELVDLSESLAPEYEEGAAYYMNSATLAYLRKLKDSTNKPILQEYADGLKVLFGKPIIKVGAMDTIAAGKKVIAYANRSCYVIGDRRTGLKVAVSENTKNGDTEFRWNLRTDGRIVDPNGIKVLQMKAS